MPNMTMMPAGKTPKHHYIPVLYLKQWAVNGRFTEFSRPPGRDRVEPRRTSPVTGRRSRSFWRLTMICSSLILINETDSLIFVNTLSRKFRNF